MSSFESDCDEEWQLLSENGFIDIFALVLAYVFTQKMISFGASELFNFNSIERHLKLIVNVLFLSTVYGYVGLILIGITASFIFVTGKIAKNRLAIMSILMTAILFLHTYGGIVMTGLKLI